VVKNDAINGVSTSLCPTNTFSTGAIDTCTPCDGGHSEVGSSSCVSTPPGQYWSGTADLPCPAGTFSESGALNLAGCLPCTEAGSYSSPGASFCLLPPAGSHAASNRSSTALCLPGSFSGIGQDSCTLCEIGKFSHLPGQDQCQFCDRKVAVLGSITKDVGTTSAEDCICPSKKYFDDSSGTCIDVPLGVNQTAIAMDRFTLVLESGWFRTSNASLDIRECSNKEQCNGGSDPQNSCSLGATGPYCQVCTDGFSSVGTESISCVPCNASGGDASSAQSHIMMIGFASLFFLLVVFFCCCCRGRKKSSDELAVAGLAMSEQLSRARSLSASMKEKALRAKSAVEKSKVPLKIMMSYFQITSGFSFNFGIKFPPVFSGWMSLMR